MISRKTAERIELQLAKVEALQKLEETVRNDYVNLGRQLNNCIKVLDQILAANKDTQRLVSTAIMNPIPESRLVQEIHDAIVGVPEHKRGFFSFLSRKNQED